MKILMIDIDTLRPDHMGCYGYARNTTPNIDKLAHDGIRFDNYYCTDAPCLPSRAALVSGMFGIRNGAVGHGGTAADRHLTGETRGFRDVQDSGNLFHIFRRAGMHTVSISTFPERHSAWWFNAGFHEMYNVGGGGMESGEEVLPVALDWLARNAGRDNWMLHLHLWDPHTPYRAPAAFGNPFENDPLDTWIDQKVFDAHLEHTGPHSINELNMFNSNASEEYPRYPGCAADLAGVKKLFDGYDCGIKYADSLIGNIIDALTETGHYDDLAVIVTSDHGENMGELGIYAEHATADRPTCRIPLIIKWPGAKSGMVSGKLLGNIDLAPTLADLLGVTPAEHWDGMTFAGELNNDFAAFGRDSLVISQMAHVCQRSALFGGWLYIRTYHDGYHLFDDEMLFNIKNDPYEQTDLKDKHPEICAQGAKIILDWHDMMMKKSGSTVDPLWTVLAEGGPFHTRGALPGYLERLAATNRANGAERLKQKYLKE